MSLFPDTLVAGDSLTVTLPAPDLYRVADSWAGTLYLNGATRLTITGSTSSDGYTFDIPAAKTANLSAGTYAYAVTLALNTARHTVASGYVTIAENAATATNRVIEVERILRLINARIEGRFDDDVESSSIAGRSLTNIPIDQLMTYRVQYMKELHVLKGGSVRKQITMTFPPLFGR